MNYRVGIVGATGAVGQEILALLAARSFPVAEVRLLASSRSAGKKMQALGREVTIEEARPEAFEGLDFAIFSAGAGISRQLAAAAVERGCLVIDNSSAFRMDEGVPLVVPEVNGSAARAHRGIIANPNCSTAIALMALCPLHRTFGLKRFFASTYQAVSGTGAEAMRELEEQVRAWAEDRPSAPKVYPHQIAFNLIPQVDVFTESGYTKEELKMLHESRKILGLPGLQVSATCVRVPVFRAHSIAIQAEFERPVSLAEAKAAIAAFPGAEVLDDPAAKSYPMPLAYAGKVNCGVGRLRLDQALENGLSLWVVGDQLWKGAALNAIQIAEALHADGALARGSWGK
jgi:aspartate-semialdehyde dehydrogenase